MEGSKRDLCAVAAIGNTAIESGNTAVRIIGNKLMGVCGNCGKIIRVDKPLLGSLHICTTEEERQKYPTQIQTIVANAERELEKA